MSKLTLGAIQVGINATADKNFIIKAPDVPDGSLEIRRGTHDAPGALLAKINADGGVSHQGPCFSAYCSVAVPMATASYTKMLLQSKEFDTHNAWDAANSRFVAPMDGYYEFKTCLYISGGVGFEKIAAIFKNGVLFKHGLDSTTCYILNSSWFVPLLKGDFIELNGYQVSGAQQTLIAGASASWFTGHWVRGL